jgi:hypothetical protein
MTGAEGMKNAEQWCFSIRKTDERLLTTVFQQREENERFAGVSATGKVVAHGVAAEEGEKRNKCWTELFRE